VIIGKGDRHPMGNAFGAVMRYDDDKGRLKPGWPTLRRTSALVTEWSQYSHRRFIRNYFC
jgi:hypothetical protein